MEEESVARSGKRVRIIANLIYAGTDQQPWSDTSKRDQRDILASRSEITKAFAHEINFRLRRQEQGRFARRAAENWEALRPISGDLSQEQVDYRWSE